MEINPMLKDFLYSEQVLNNYSLYSEEHQKEQFGMDIPQEYQPTSQFFFKLPYFLIPLDGKNALIEYKQSLHDFFEKNLFFRVDETIYYPFFVHPTTEPFFKKWLGDAYSFVAADESVFEATPTSSFRSLVVQNSATGDFFVAKVTILANVTNGSRHIDWNSAIGQFQSSQFLRDCLGSRNDFELFEDVGAFGITGNTEVVLSERFKVAFGPRKIKSFGTVIRMIPDSLLRNKARICSIASFTSLINKTANYLHKAWKTSNVEFLEFVEQYLFQPLSKIILEFYQIHGIVFEPHCQNTMIELDDLGRLTGKFYYRDFDMTALDRVRFPFVHPDNWRCYIHNRPDRNTMHTNIGQRDAVGVCLFQHFIENLITPCLNSGFKQGLGEEAELNEYKSQKIGELKSFLHRIIPHIDPQFLETGIKWDYGKNYFSVMGIEEIPEELEPLKTEFNKDNYVSFFLSIDASSANETFLSKHGYVVGVKDRLVKTLWVPKKDSGI